MAVLLSWPLSPWLSPAAAWFIFFNAVVAAIAVMSCTAASPPPSSRRRLCRSRSSVVLDRLRSFSIFAVHPVAGGVAGTTLDDDDTSTSSAAASGAHCYRCCSLEAEEVSRAPEQPGRGPLAPTAGTAMSSATPPGAPVVLASADATPAAPAPEEEEHKAEAEEVQEEEQDESISLDEAYALAQRRRAQEQASPAPASATTATNPTAKARTKRPAKVVAEGISRRRRTKAEEVALEGKAELNARAELFIRQFREDLKLQRVNSILSHTNALGAPTAAR